MARRDRAADRAPERVAVRAPVRGRATSGIDEAAARTVLLVREIESAPSDAASWSAADRAWASRSALDSVGRDAGASRFLVARAELALQRLLPREPVLAAWLAPKGWRAGALVWALLIGAAVGLGIDSLGSHRLINLLAPPLWGVLVWNLAVYALLAVAALRRLGPARSDATRTLDKLSARHGPLTRWLHAALTSAPWAPRASTQGGRGAAAVLHAFAPAWARVSLPQNLARAEMLLHGAAGALALGLIAGLYLRGLVFDYRAGWQSTFLDAATAHAVLSFVLAPAAAVTGITLPDASGFEALRSAAPLAPGGATSGATSGAIGNAIGSATAAPWIHLLAASLGLFVVLPRFVLCLASAARARWLAAHVHVPLHEPYFQRLLREQRGAAASIQVLPYAQAPPAQALLSLQALFARALGQNTSVQVGDTIAFGAEDEVRAAPAFPAGTTHALLWFDMAATPEPEHHGRIAAALAQSAAASGAAAMLLLDQTAFVRRFAQTPNRIAERLAAWRQLADAAQLSLLAVDFDPARVGRAEGELWAALEAAPPGFDSEFAP